jgi:hypothetical protein
MAHDMGARSGEETALVADGEQGRTRRAAGGVGLAARLAASLLAAASSVSALAPPARLEVGIVAALVPAGGEDGELALPFVVEVAAGEPAGDAAAAFRGEVRFVLAAADSGQTRAAFVQPFELPRTGADGGPLAGLRLYGELRLPDGRYELEAAARDLDSGATGEARLAVASPAERDAGWLASQALFVDRRPGWRALRTSELPESDLPFPFLDANGAFFLPAARSEASSGAPLSAFALLAATGHDFPFVVGELVDVADGSVHELPVAVLALTPASQQGLALAQLELGPVPRPGSFRVRLATARPDGIRESPFASGPELRIAPRQAVAAAAPRAPAAVAAGAAGLEAGYLRVIARLAADGLDGAASALVDFERTALATRPSGRLAELREAEQRIFEQLTRRDPAVRAALLVLHQAAVEVAHRRRDAWLYAQSRRFLAELTRGPARAPAAERAFAADVLALSDSAAALELDPRHRLALLRQTLELERTGQLDAAAATVARLVETDAEDPHARLRLAVIARRRGEAKLAFETFSGLVASPAPAWVHELAYSELAALDRAFGRPRAAIAVLQMGIARLEAQALHLQLAFYLDEANQPGSSTAVVHRLPIALDGARPSARHLYALDPWEELEAVRRRVRGRAEAAFPALAAALGTASRGPG